MSRCCVVLRVQTVSLGLRSGPAPAPSIYKDSASPPLWRQASEAGGSRPSRGSRLLCGELGLGGPLGLELLDGVECLVESESGCGQRRGR